MELKDLIARARQIRESYKKLEAKEYDRSWTRAEVAQGFMGDIGQLMKLLMAKDGRRAGPENLDEKLAHELADCLWCVLVIADEYGVDLEQSFLRTMNDIQKKLEP
jgi:NTP pyrophosphatase (non-canonical NTP hydrolase)